MENVIEISHSIERKGFLKKVYFHLLLAIIGFTGLEYLWFTTPVADSVLNFIEGQRWIFIIGAFMLASWIATRLSESESKAMQYLGLAGYTLAESLIFIPLLHIAQYKTGSDIIATAGYITVISFISLTAIVFLTNVNLVGWGKYILWSGVVALSVIVCSPFIGFNLGVVFSAMMVCLAGIAILYDTSMIIHHYEDRAYVGASLRLFASIAMLFWYVSSILNRKD